MPDEFLGRSDWSPATKLVAMVILDEARRGRPWSHRSIAKRCNLSTGTVYSAISLIRDSASETEAQLTLVSALENEARPASKTEAQDDGGASKTEAKAPQKMIPPLQSPYKEQRSENYSADEEPIDKRLCEHFKARFEAVREIPYQIHYGRDRKKAQSLLKTYKPKDIAEAIDAGLADSYHGPLMTIPYLEAQITRLLELARGNEPTSKKAKRNDGPIPNVPANPLESLQRKAMAEVLRAGAMTHQQQLRAIGIIRGELTAANYREVVDRAKQEVQVAKGDKA